jgi:hypothetical protein
VFPFGPGKLAPPVGLLLGGEQLDILAQRALIAFEGADMIFSPESPVNEPRPRLDPEPKGAPRSIRSASVPPVSDVATVEGVPDLATGKTEASLKIG